MNFCMKKITDAADNKSFHKGICQIAKKIHEISKCEKEDCEVDQFIFAIDHVIKNMKSDEFDVDERAKFIEMSKKYVKTFLVCDQLFKKYGSEFYHLEDCKLKFAIYFEVEKVNSFVENIEKLKFLTAKNAVVEKTYL